MAILRGVTALLVAAWIFCAPLEAAASRPITLTDLGLEVGLEGVTLSPDGRLVALVTSRQDFIDNRYVRTLVLVETSTGAHREFTPGRTQVGSPRWSPSGDRLAWLDSDSGGKTQVYVRAMSQSSAAAVAITEAAEGVSTFRWSPDGVSIAFLTTDTAGPREGEERHNKSFEVGANDFLTTAVPVPSHLWVVAATGGPAKRLSAGADSLTGFEWIEGGQAIAFVSQRSPHAGEALNTTLGRIEVLDGARRSLMPTTAAGAMDVPPAKEVEAPGLGLLEASPDGRMVSYGRSRGPQPLFWPQGVYVLPSSGGVGRDLAPTLDYNLQEMTWLPKGEAVLLVASVGTRTGLWVQPLIGAPRRVQVSNFTALSRPSVSRTGAVVFTGSDSQRASELYFMASLNARPKQLTRFNEAFGTLELGRVETVRWQLEGFEQDGVLIYPPNFQSGRKYPLALNIHGGPMGASTEGFSAFGQLLAAQGWLVFQPNYRGSDNRGAKFQSAIVNDAGDGPGRDVMAGVAAIRSRGIVDESRMAVSGWSYGGFMTVWLSAHYPVWRAAVAGAAVTDWLDQYNTSDLASFFGYGLNGSPWLDENAANYWRQSPMAYAHRIRAPTLILSMTGDRRVTITQSYKLYHALKDNGVPVQFIAYPIDGHWPEDPVHQRDVYRRWVGWIAERFSR